MKTSTDYIQYAAQLAYPFIRQVQPNPPVGAVWVHDQKILGKGSHQKYGEAHAEVMALRKADQVPLDIRKNSTLYVTLMPCNHHGKTPPCTDLIIEKQIGSVVVSCPDPNTEVRGGAHEKLLAAGIKVQVGMADPYTQQILRPFTSWVQKKRPYILLKYAKSQNNRIGSTKKQIWMTNSTSKRLVHKWRSEVGAILVGQQTIFTDNPRLTTRLWPGPSPLRIVLAPDLAMRENYQIISDERPSWIYTRMPMRNPPGKATKIIPIQSTEALLSQVLKDLYEANIQTLMVEGGRFTLEQFIEQDFWDEARVFTAPHFTEGDVLAPSLEHTPAHHSFIGQDRLDVYYNDGAPL